MFHTFLRFFDLVGKDAVILARALVNLALIPSPLAFSFKFVTTSAELGDSLLRQELLECPLLNVLLFVLLQLSDELHGALEN